MSFTVLETNLLLPVSVLAGTGHRPDKLGGWSANTNDKLLRLAFDYLAPKRDRLKYIISGMAAGFDLAWAEAAQLIGIPVYAAVPFPGHHLKWSDAERERYYVIRKRCRFWKNVSEIHDIYAYQRRNEWMVDNAYGLVALWDGSSGGTANCVNYALGKVPVENIWDKWSEC